MKGIIWLFMFAKKEEAVDFIEIACWNFAGRHCDLQLKNIL